MPGSHAKLSPSAASIWMNCPGSVVLSEGLESRSSDYADCGSMAHHYLEKCLSNGYQGKRFLGAEWTSPDTGKVFTMEAEDVDAIQIALDWIRAEIEPGDEYEMETQLRYTDDFWGTCDFNRYRPGTAELLVVDYKHGAGVPVEAFENPQGVSYGLMKARQLGNRGLASVRFAIIQPRASHEDGPVREFTIDGADMLEWEDRIVDAIERVHGAAAGRDNPDWNDFYVKRGKWCRWCPANFVGGCPLVERDIQAAAELDFALGYDPKKLAEGLAICDRAESAIKATRAFAYQEADNGVAIPGFKLVDKRPVERWAKPEDAAGAAELLGVAEDEIYEPRALLSPAQLRAVLEPVMDGKTKKARTEAAKIFLSDFTEKVSSGTTLVPDSDPRPAATKGATHDFDPIED